MLVRTVIALVFFAIGALAQDSRVELPEGQTLAIRIDHSVKAVRAHPGDAVQATLLAPVLSRGSVLIPQSARIRGRVLAAGSRQGGNASLLVIRFEQAQWRQSSVAMNAYVSRQLVERTTVVYGGSGSPCTAIARMFYQRRGADPPTVQPPRGSYAPCDERIGITQEARSERMVFTSPPMKDIQLLRVAAPAGATALVSSKKNITLSRGTILEIRQTAP